MKNTPQFSIGLSVYASPLANVMRKLSYSHEIEYVSGISSGSASGTAKKAPFAVVRTGTFPSAFMNQWATSTWWAPQSAIMPPPYAYQALKPSRLGLNGRLGAGPCHISQSSPAGTGASASFGRV